MSRSGTTATNFVATETLISCPNCSGRKLVMWCKAHDRLHELTGQKFSYSLCQCCRLLFLSLRPLEAEMHRFYPDNYEPHRSAHRIAKVEAVSSNGIGQLIKGFMHRAGGFLNSIFNTCFPDSFPKALQLFYRPPMKGARLLDFGCGSDQFLNWAREQGWRTVGIDFAARSVEQVRVSGHLAFLMSPTVWTEIEDESLDCVRMNHVLEHLYHPQEILMALKRKMKTGGRLHVAVPNPGGLSACLFGGWWRGLDCPRHVALYPAETLHRLLIESGFAEADVRHETATRDLIGSLGYVLRDAKLIGQLGLDQMLDSEILNMLFFIPARLAARFSRGDRIHVLVTKG